MNVRHTAWPLSGDRRDFRDLLEVQVLSQAVAGQGCAQRNTHAETPHKTLSIVA
jgi:hypothetical protein